MGYSFTAGIVGIGLSAIIVWLLRRDQLYVRDALFWILVAVASSAFAFFPRAIDWVGSYAGIAYPPALLLGIVCLVLTVKAVLGDIAIAQLRRDVRRLAQAVAITRQETAVASEFEPDSASRNETK